MATPKDIKKNIEKSVTEKIANDFSTVAEQIVEQFYSSYDPLSYSRTGNLRGGIRIRKINSLGLCGCIVDGSGVSKHKEVTGDYVFRLMWDYGVRGLPEYGKYHGREFGDDEPRKQKKSEWVNPHFMRYRPCIKEPETGTLLYGESPQALMTNYLNNWEKINDKWIKEYVDNQVDTLEF